MQFDVRRLDVYRKVPKDLTEPTFTGAIVSVLSCLFILFLLVSEFFSFIAPEVKSELFVDDPGDVGRISVRINVTLPEAPCQVVGLDIQDDLGRHEVGFVEDVKKMIEFGGKGCRFEAKFNINRVPGNFHVSTHATGHQAVLPVMRHKIHEVSFGDKVIKNKNVNGAFNPLKDIDYTRSDPEFAHDYFLKIVPTIYESLSSVNNTYAYQYTYAHKEYKSQAHGRQVTPAIWFRYDLSAITVKYIEKRPPIYHFITTVCAIVGGTFTVAGIIDSCIFTASNIFKKAELGKLS